MEHPSLTVLRQYDLGSTIASYTGEGLKKCTLLNASIWLNLIAYTKTVSLSRKASKRRQVTLWLDGLRVLSSLRESKVISPLTFNNGFKTVSRNPVLSCRA